MWSRLRTFVTLCVLSLLPANLAAEPSMERARPSKSDAPSKPERPTQVQKSVAERGVNPCNTPDPGFGSYEPWSRAPSMGQMLMPKTDGIGKSGDFDVMFHFHGHEAARKEWVKVMDGVVLVGIDLGLGSGPYEKAFQPPEIFKNLIESVQRAVAKARGRAHARARHIGLSAWSAGYGAIQTILNHGHDRERVDAVILLDGLHSGYAGNTLNELQLNPFIRFAREAAERSKFLFVSHSSIIPPGYASTTETANFLIQRVGGEPVKASPRAGDPLGLELIGRFSRGNFHVRGYSGNGKLDHCAHIGLYADVLKVHIKPRWRSPRAQRN